MLFRSPAIRWTTVLLLLLIAITPSLVFAQFPTSIVPDNCRDANAAQNCGICDIGQLAQNLLNAGIYIAVFLSAIFFAYAGWQYLTSVGNQGKVDDAKRIFWMVGIGLVLILAAWLIVDLIMKMMVNSNALFGPWNAIC